MQSDSERTHRKFIRILFPNTQHWEEIGNQGLILASFKSSSVSSFPGSGSLKAFHTQDAEKPQRQKEIVSKQTNKKVSCQLSPTASSGKPRLFFISNPSSTFLCLQNFTQSFCSVSLSVPEVISQSFTLQLVFRGHEKH